MARRQRHGEICLTEGSLPHPFFDSQTYPWHLEVSRELHRRLASAVTLPGRIEVLYQSCGGPFPVLAASDPLEMWRVALTTIAVAQSLRELGKQLRQHQPSLPAVLAAFVAIENANDPVQTPGLQTGRIVLDRRDLRDTLEELAKPAGNVQVLLVRGGDKVGKTWTRYPTQEVAHSIGAEWCYIGEGSVATAEEAIQLLFGKVGGRPPDAFSTTSAYYRLCCVELAKLVDQRKRSLWIIGDDLGLKDGVSKLDEEIRAFFDHVALMMDTGVFGDRVRLVLLDYPDVPVPTRWQSFWTEDRPQSGNVTEDDVVDCLLRWAKHKNFKLLDSDAKQSAADILAKIAQVDPADSRPELKRLHDAVERTVKGMRQT